MTNKKILMTSIIAMTLLTSTIAAGNIQQAFAGGIGRDVSIFCEIEPDPLEEIILAGEAKLIQKEINCSTDSAHLFEIDELEILTSVVDCESPLIVDLTLETVGTSDPDNLFAGFNEIIEVDPRSGPGDFHCEVEFQINLFAFAFFCEYEDENGAYDTFGPFVSQDDFDRCDDLDGSVFELSADADMLLTQEIWIEVPPPPTASVHVLKFNDLNANGVQDEGEDGLEGWEITIECDEFSDMQLTDVDGLVWFEEIPAPNLCQVSEELVQGWTPTTETSVEVDLEPGEEENVEFGNAPPASIHVLKFNDLDGDGVHDAEEPVIPVWGIELVCDDGTSDFQETNAEGLVWFEEIPAPNICEVSEEQRDGWVPTTETSVEVDLEPGEEENVEFGNRLVIEVVKIWTHTDYLWGLVCDVQGAVVVGDRCFVGLDYVGPARQANINYNGQEDPQDPPNLLPDDDVLADALPFDEDIGKYVVDATVHPKNGKFQNTQPGAFYALTTVEVAGDVDGLSVWEVYADCTIDDEDTDVNEAELKLLAPENKQTRAIKVAIADPQGFVTEITELLYDDIDGTIHTTDLGSAHVDILQEIEAGSTVFVLVKFEDNLKGELFLEEPFEGMAMCDNSEDVWVLEFDEDEEEYFPIFSDDAFAALKINAIQ